MNTQNPYSDHKSTREHERTSEERSRNMKKILKQIAIWGSTAVVLGLAIWGIVFLVQHYEPPKGPNSNITLDQAITAADWVKGSRDAKVVLTEYSDFQCPACAAYFPLLKQLHGEFPNDLAIVYRHFPLDMHTNAKPMARAAEAAGKQNKFWEMHDLIFTNQNNWSNKSNVKETVVEYARTLGLNTVQFEKDFDSDEIKDKVDQSLTDAVRLGLGYTPSLFINGKLVPNPSNYNDFKALVTEAIANNTTATSTQQ